MSKRHRTSDLAALFVNGRSQAVRLPREFRFPGTHVRIRKTEEGVLLTPVYEDVDAWFAEIDRLGTPDLFEDGRQQPPMPEDRQIFD